MPLGSPNLDSVHYEHISLSNVGSWVSTQPTSPLSEQYRKTAAPESALCHPSQKPRKTGGHTPIRSLVVVNENEAPIEFQTHSDSGASTRTGVSYSSTRAHARSIFRNPILSSRHRPPTNEDRRDPSKPDMVCENLQFQLYRMEVRSNQTRMEGSRQRGSLCRMGASGSTYGVLPRHKPVPFFPAPFHDPGTTKEPAAG
jgi:hypothetical protein